MQESERVEYKQELNTELDIEKEVIAFLNHSTGGRIFIGINKYGKTHGVKDTDSDMLRIKDRVRHNISPSAMGLFDVNTEIRDGKTIIRINVAAGSEKPYFKKKFGMTEKGCFIRIGTASEPMPQSMIERLFASRTRNSIGKIRSNYQRLRFEQLRIFYEEIGKPLSKAFKRNLELVTEKGALNYAAYMLADRNSISIKVAKYHGTTRSDLAESNEYGYCSLIKATKSVLGKVDVENRTITLITSAERVEQRLWHPIALREAIINAIVHNEYTREISPKIEIFSDRLEITSAGSLPEGLNEQEFFEGFSIPRNKELMRIYKDLGLVEQLGSGIPRILHHYGTNCFNFSENFLRMSFPAKKMSDKLKMNTHRPNSQRGADTINNIEKEKVSEEMQNDFGSISGRIREEFGIHVVKTFATIQSNPTLTAQQIATLIGKTSRTVEMHLMKLKSAGHIRRKGPKFGGYWEVD